MFERYTERARRVLFFARYEASQLGSVAIELSHCLLGLLRESQGPTKSILRPKAEALRKVIERDFVEHNEKVSVSVEIPFSASAKSMLMQAAAEADLRRHSYIGTEHLLLALLREETPFSPVLASFDITYATVTRLLFDPAAIVDAARSAASRELVLTNLGLSDRLPDLRGLAHVTDLDLSGNELTHVPREIAQLRTLTSLNLSNNRITEIPEWLLGLSLRRLFLHGNPPLNIPGEILGPTPAEVSEGQAPARPRDILNYASRLAGARQLNEAKLILVGRGGVGKTSLVNRLLWNSYNPTQTKTDGINIDGWTIPLEGADPGYLHVWDFGGQEIMHATHQFFLTQRSIYLVVLSGREGSEDADAEYWLRLVSGFSDGSPAIVVLNKIEEYRFDLNRRSLMQHFPFVKGFVETDCETSSGIPELRRCISAVAQQLDGIHAEFPASWWRIKTELGLLKENFLSYDDYRRLCTTHGEADEGAQDELATHLHHLGVALNFRRDPRLQHTHVLNPHWVTNGIYSILTSEHLARTRGELRLADLERILDRKLYPLRMHTFIMDLMKKFELCFSFPEDESCYLVPELLDKQEPEAVESFDTENSLVFTFRYPIIPEGLFPRFIVRSRVLSEGQLRWRTGVLLRFEGNEALVRVDPSRKAIEIFVNGPTAGRTRLLAVIRSDFERIHRGLKAIAPEQYVHVPGYPIATVKYEDLLIWEREGRMSYPVRVGDRVLDLEIRQLLTGIELDGQAAGADAGAPVRVFCSYSHRDEPLRAELDTHLKLLQRIGLIDSWSDRRIEPGEDFGEAIEGQASRADVVLLLVSADFIASDYCYDREMKWAMARHVRGDALVVPIVVRDVNWSRAPFAKLQVLPRNGVAVASWPNRDAAWRDVASGIESAIADRWKRHA